MTTPAMKQWYEIKQKYPEHILLFRMGDFYEMFYQDAEEASKILGIALTKRGVKEKIPLAGIPYKSLNQYLKKLIDAKKKVIIVEQLEDPKKAKGIVKRGIVREITPGTIAFSDMLPENENNYLASVFFADKIYLSIADITTGELYYLIADSLEELSNQLFLYEPKEIIFPEYQKEHIEKLSLNTSLTPLKSDFIKLSELKGIVLPLFSNISDDNLILSLGTLLKYIKITQQNDLSYFKEPKRINLREEMILDEITINNLDILKNSFYGNTKATLYEVMNETKTSMGARLLKKWLIKPLMNLNEILRRQKIVEFFVNDVVALESVREHLTQIFDLERLTTKIFNNTATHSDLIRLKQSLITYASIYNIASRILSLPDPNNFKIVVELLDASIEDDVTSDNIIKRGYNQELDELRHLKESTNDLLQELEIKEKQKTGLQNLRVKYNKVFGFFIEVPKAQAKRVPEYYVRKQTLVNSERFVIPELKELEQKFLSADERIKELEEELFNDIIKKIKPYGKSILELAEKLAELDVLQGFSKIALEYNYVKPVFKGNDIVIIAGRHPVVERFTDFIPNDTKLLDSQVHIITGPNMSGKSTYLRQVALIQLLAQIGSFVPAQYAQLPIVDAIFTRIGARDNIALGESTFMVEMKETGNILKNATKKSLIILDEVGRGTSTYDGISLAWSITEYIIRYIHAKTLFATHYHVLTHLANFYENVVNYHTLIKETDKGIIFERKIVLGGLDKSYGIEVAKLAKLPQWVIERAYQLQKGFERYDNLKDNVVKALLDLSSNRVTIKTDKLSNEYHNSRINESSLESESRIQSLINSQIESENSNPSFYKKQETKQTKLRNKEKKQKNLFDYFS